MRKRHPRELFLLVQIGLITLLPCIVSAGLKAGVGVGYSRATWQALHQWILSRGEKYQIVVERMIPEGMNYNMHVIL